MLLNLGKEKREKMGCLDEIIEGVKMLEKYFDLVDVIEKDDYRVKVLLRKYPYMRVGVYIIRDCGDRLVMEAGCMPFGAEEPERWGRYEYLLDNGSCRGLGLFEDIIEHFRTFCF